MRLTPLPPLFFAEVSPPLPRPPLAASANIVCLGGREGGGKRRLLQPPPPSAKATLSIGRDVGKKCTKEGRRGPFVAPFRRQCALLLPFYPLHALFQRRYFVLPFRKQRSCPPSLVSWRRRRRRRLHRLVARAAPALKILWRAISR